MSDELDFRDVSDLRRALVPGDILMLSMRREENPHGLRGFIGAAYEKIAPSFLTDTTHSAMYVGNGRIVEARLGENVTVKKLQDAVGSLDARVIRPSVSPLEKAKAVDFVKKQIGKPYSTAQLVGATVGLVVPAPVTRLMGRALIDSDKPEAFTCSSLIAQAYRDSNLAPGGIGAAAPIDFVISGKTRAVGELVQAGRDERDAIIGRAAGFVPLGTLGLMGGGTAAALAAKKGMQMKLRSLKGVGAIGAGMLGGLGLGLGSRALLEARED